MKSFLDSSHLLNSKQFGFRSKRSASDPLLQKVISWNKTLDPDKETRRWPGYHKCLLQSMAQRLKSFGIDGDLQKMIKDYLRRSTLQVVVNGYISGEYPIRASVPQGSVIGPLLWNVYFSDILHVIPEAHTYAEVCTLSISCEKQ